MSTQIQVNKSNAVQAYINADTAGKTLLQALFGKEVFDSRITSFEEALNQSGKKHFIAIGMPDDEIAFAKLKIIIKQLNGDWKADWSNGEQEKYMLWLNMSPFSLDCVVYYYDDSCVPSCLCFRDWATAEYFASVPEFFDLYKTYMLGQ